MVHLAIRPNLISYQWYTKTQRVTYESFIFTKQKRDSKIQGSDIRRHVRGPDISDDRKPRGTISLYLESEVTGA